jgi:hypothetical protein
MEVPEIQGRNSENNSDSNGELYFHISFLLTIFQVFCPSFTLQWQYALNTDSDDEPLSILRRKDVFLNERQSFDKTTGSHCTKKAQGVSQENYR